jgi:hypothetical protein
MIVELMLAAGTGAATLFGYVKSRRFVRERLRFVDAAHKPTAPIVAGAAAALAAGPVVWLLPFVGAPTTAPATCASVCRAARPGRRPAPPAP